MSKLREKVEDAFFVFANSLVKRSISLVALMVLGASGLGLSSQVENPQVASLVSWGGAILLGIAAIVLVYWSVIDVLRSSIRRGFRDEEAHVAGDDFKSDSRTRSIAPDPLLFEKADDEFRKRFRAILEENKDGMTKLRSLANECVRACMIACGEQWQIRDYDNFWVKFYGLKRDSLGRFVLFTAACSDNTPREERGITLTFNEGGAGYVLARSLRSIDEGNFAPFMYICDRRTVLARLGHRNRKSLESSSFGAECCLPIVGVDDDGNPPSKCSNDGFPFYGVACFCASGQDAKRNLSDRRRKNRMENIARAAGYLTAKTLHDGHVPWDGFTYKLRTFVASQEGDSVHSPVMTG